MIGTSWIYTNGKFFAKYGAGGEIFGLVIAGLFAACIALAYGELASTFPRAGGEVVFAYAAYNRFSAFLAGWLVVGGYMSSLAFYVTGFGLLLADLVPSVESVPLYTINGTTVHLPVLVLGVALVFVVYGLNYFGVSLSAQVQLVMFAVMIMLGIALVATGFVSGSASNFWPPYGGNGNPVAQTIRFVLPAMTFFSGFGLVANLAEDVKLRPARIGKAVVATVALAGAFYVLVLLASAWVIPWEQTATLPKGTIDAFRTAGYPLIAWFAYGISVLGLVTSFLGLFMATSRIVLALSRVGLLPASLSGVHPRYGTPVPGLTFTMVVTLALGWLGTGAITWFLDTGGVYLGIVWALGVACLYRIPRRYPGIEQPYRTRYRWAPAAGGIIAVLVIAFALWPDTAVSLVWPQEHAILLGWFGLGLVLYLITPRYSDERALRTLLGSYYSKIAPSQTAATEVAPSRGSR